MKSTLPQLEFAFSCDAFNLSPEMGVDGARVQAEKEKRAADKASAAALQTALPEVQPAKGKCYPGAGEFGIIRLREIAPPHERPMVDTPDRAASYYRQHIETSPRHQATVENFAVVFLDTRRRAVGHQCCASGTRDTLLTSPSDLFRAAMLCNAAAVVLAHNHPSGDPTPSEADIRVTRDLIRAGLLLKIEVLDHVVMGHSKGHPAYLSLRELGYFYT